MPIITSPRNEFRINNVFPRVKLLTCAGQNNPSSTLARYSRLNGQLINAIIIIIIVGQLIISSLESTTL